MKHKFTLENYISILELAKTLRVFRTYGTLAGNQEVENAMLWRHDVDFSLLTAVKIARLDHEHGVTSNFFINIHADTYNARSATGREQIEWLIRLGHSVQIHLDAAYYGTFNNEDHLLEALEHEKDVFRAEFKVDVAAFSFHNPTARELTYTADHYAGLVNCYAQRFQTSIPYASDSNGFWRFRTAEEVLLQTNDSVIQVLTHAEWWSQKQQQPRERLAQAFFEDAFVYLAKYDDSLEKYGRENQSDLPLGVLRHDEREKGLRAFKLVFGGPDPS